MEPVSRCGGGVGSPRWLTEDEIPCPLVDDHVSAGPPALSYESVYGEGLVLLSFGATGKLVLNVGPGVCAP